MPITAHKSWHRSAAFFTVLFCTPIILSVPSKQRDFVEQQFVPIENGALLTTQNPITKQLLKAISLLSQQFVSPERVKQTNMLTAGLVALAKKSTHFELLRSGAENETNKRPLISRLDGELNVALCRNKALSICSAVATQKTLAASPLESASLFRFGDRVIRVPQKFELDNNIIQVASIAAAVIETAPSSSAPSQEQLVHAFINGITEQLDPHSAFLSAEEWQELKSSTHGEFDGIGLVLRNVANLPTVDEVIPGSSADRAGIQTGDIIINVQNKVSVFVPLDQISTELRSLTTDSSATARIFRPSTQSVFTAKFTREQFPSESVEAGEIPGTPLTFYARISSFSSQTTKELKTALDRELLKNPIARLIIDLRGNPGGLLDEAVKVANLFIREGRIVSVRTRFDAQDENANSLEAKYTFPIAVLVDSGSASASEIVAGALRDHHRAIIIGERTFGKASVQSIFETENGTALKLTVAHYFTPSGRSIQGGGITPHISIGSLVRKNGLLWIAGATETEREEQLPLHLSNPEISEYATPMIFQEPENTLWIEQKENDFAVEIANVPVLPRRTQNWQEPRSADHDPTLRVAINALNSIATEGNITGRYLPPQLSEIQKMEIKNMSAATTKLFELRTAPQKWRPYDMKRVSDNHHFKYEFSLSGEHLPPTVPLVLRISGYGDGSALITEGNVRKDGEKTAKISFSIPKDVFAMRSLQGETNDIFVSIKPSLLVPEIPVGPIQAASSEYKTSSPSVSVSAPRECSKNSEYLCTKLQVSFSNLYSNKPAQMLLAPFVSKTPSSTAIAVIRVSSPNPNSQDFEVEIPMGKSSPLGVLGLIFQTEDGEVLGRWAIANLTKNGVEALSTHIEVASRIH